MIRAAAAFAAFALSASRCLAVCTTTEIGAITFSGTTLPAYDPFTAPTPRLLTVNVTSTVACSVELAFQSTSNPARMIGPGALTYDVQVQGSATSLLFVSGMPTTTTRIDIPAGNVGSVTVQIARPPNQVVSSGPYGDASLVAHIYDKAGSVLAPLKSASVPISGSVAAACRFSAPTNPTMNLSSAISHGLPQTGIVGTVTLPSLNCTAPSLVRLSAGPMRHASAGATAAFDNMIDFRAIATLAGATAVLDTRSGPDAVSTLPNVVSGATIDGSVRIDVNLIAGRPLLAGAYASLLTLSIDPIP